MWCLIRFHWAVCHYFISRAICRASEKNSSPPERWAATVEVWKLPLLMERTTGTRLSETVREGRRPPPAWRRRYLMASSWFTVFTGRRMNSNVEGVPLPGWLCASLSSVRLAQRGGASAATQQEALCVCVHVCAGFEASTEKALYLRYSVPTIPPSVSWSRFFSKG